MNPRRLIGRLSSCLALAACLALPAVASPKPASKKPSVRKVPATVLERMQVYHDGKGHFIVAPTFLESVPSKIRYLFHRHLYFGNKRSVYQLRTRATAVKAKPGDHYYQVFDPRRGFTSLRIEGDRYYYRCGTTKSPLRRLTPAAAKRFLDKVTFRSQYWKREPHLLSRNDEGEYFYVDRARATTRRGGLRFHPPLSELRDFRLWRGRRGRMKRVKLQDVVIDSAGQIFLSKKGALHVSTRKYIAKRSLVKNRRVITKLAWRDRRTNKRQKLTLVPLDTPTLKLIHRQLGPYIGVKVGLPCDVW